MLVDLKTDLKSLQWGNDQLGGGSSGQPYIQTPIPDDPSLPPTNEGNDFLYRGGFIGAGKTGVGGLKPCLYFSNAPGEDEYCSHSSSGTEPSSYIHLRLDAKLALCNII